MKSTLHALAFATPSFIEIRARWKSELVPWEKRFVLISASRGSVVAIESRFGDGARPATGFARVVRGGGAYHLAAWRCRSAGRGVHPPDPG